MKARCANCRKWFEAVTGRRTCSRSCQVGLSWKNPAVAEARAESIRARCLTPERRAKIIATNNLRWARPGEKEKLAQQNRREWKMASEKRRRSIKAAWGPELRALLSDIKKAHWRDPVIRQRMNDAAAASQKTQEYRRTFSEHLKKRWRDPKMRKVMLAAVRRTAKDPKLRAANSARMKRLWADPAWAAAARAKMVATKIERKAARESRL